MLVHNAAGQYIQSGRDSRLWISPCDHHAGKDGGSGAGSANDSSPVGQSVQLAFHFRTEIRLGQARLLSPFEPDAGGLAERRDKFGGVGLVTRTSMQNVNAGHAELGPGFQQLCLLLVPTELLVGLLAGGGNDDEQRLLATGQFDEPLENLQRQFTAAGNDERSLVSGGIEIGGFFPVQEWRISQAGNGKCDRH